MEEAARLCDRVGIIHHGKLLAVDTVPTLLGTLGGAPTLVLARSGGEYRVQTMNPLDERTGSPPSSRWSSASSVRRSNRSSFTSPGVSCGD